MFQARKSLVGVRVRLKISVRGRVVQTKALVNTGFETVEPELLIPAKLAERLRLYLLQREQR